MQRGAGISATLEWKPDDDGAVEMQRLSGLDAGWPRPEWTGIGFRIKELSAERKRCNAPVVPSSKPLISLKNPLKIPLICLAWR